MPNTNADLIWDERAHLMERMQETLGILQERQENPPSPEDLGAAAIACTGCQAVEKCQSWLDEQEIIGRTSEPTFCPNYDRFMNGL